MFKKLASVTLAATAALVPQAAMAEQIQTVHGGLRYLDREHAALVNAITNAGVTVRINVGSECRGGHDGVYKPQAGILAVCQDNAPKAHWDEVRWTANDLDTLRHEAVHLLQDCKAGDGLGGYSRLWFNTDRERVNFVTKNLTPDHIRWIIDTYTKNGGNQFVVESELEAFSVAASIDPVTIASAINATCPA